MDWKRFWLGAGILCCLLAAAHPLLFHGQIAAGGKVCTRQGAAVEALPDASVPAGILRSITHWTLDPPQKDLTAVNLDPRFAGAALYWDGSTLYLEDPGGGFLPFR